MRLFPLPPSEAHLWFVEQKSITPPLLERYIELLSPAERERYQRFVVPEPAEEFLVGRALLRSILGAYLGTTPQEIRLRLGPYGKPELAEAKGAIDFSLAHSHGLVACALARNCELGVDVERVRTVEETLELAERFFERWEYLELSQLPARVRSFRFLQYWTLKEACLKALGTGLKVPLDRFCFEFGPDGTPRPLAALERDAWQLAQLKLGEEHLAALAIRRKAPLLTRRLVVRRCIPLRFLKSQFHDDFSSRY